MHKTIEEVRGGSGQDDVIFCSEGWGIYAIMTDHDGGEGGKNWRFSHDVICEWPLIKIYLNFS